MDELKDIIRSLKIVIEDSDSLASDDKRLVKLLLENFRTQIYIKLFDYMLDESNEISNMVNELDEKINEYKAMLAEAEAKQNSSIISYSSRRVNAINKVIRNITNIKNELEDRENLNDNIPIRVKACETMFDNASTQELVDCCTTSLALGYMDFYPLYGEKLAKRTTASYHTGYKVNFDLVEKITDVMMKKNIHKELLDYSDIVISCDKKEIAYDKNRVILRIMEAIAPYKEYVIEYIKNTIDAKASIGDINELKAMKTRVNSEINEYKTNPITTVFNYSKIERCKTALDEVNDDISEATVNYERKMSRCTEIQAILNSISDARGVLDSAKSLDEYGRYDDRDTPEFIAMTKMLEVTKGKDDLDNILSELKVKADTLEGELQVAKEEKAKAYEGLSLEAKEYAEDIYSTREVIGILYRESRYNRTPAICAFILRMIGDTKKISWQNLKSIVELVQKVDIDKVQEKYADLIELYLMSAKKDVEEVEREYEYFEDESRERTL